MMITLQGCRTPALMHFSGGCSLWYLWVIPLHSVLPRDTSFDGRLNLSLHPLQSPGVLLLCQPEKVHKTILASGMEKQLLQYKQG